MPRRPEPHYWGSRKAWYCELRGKQKLLAKGSKAETKAEAYATFHRLMADVDQEIAPPANMKLATLCDLLLDEVKRHKKPLTFETYKRHLESFCRKYGRFKAADIKPLHVTRWLNANVWADTTRHGAITAVKRAFSWGKRQGYLTANPLADMEKPTPAAREAIPDREGIARILEAAARAPFKAQRPGSTLTGREFRDFLDVLDETAMRPSEAMAIEASMIDWDRDLILMDSKTTSRTKRKREIHLTARAKAILSRQAEKHPEGPLLRNARGRPWTRNATACRFARLREKLGMGKEATSEALRHAWITDALEAGVPIATVSAMVGHVDTTMVSRVYSKLYDRQGHLKEALMKVRPGAGEEPTASEPGAPSALATDA